jgi:hypothetical protein
MDEHSGVGDTTPLEQTSTSVTAAAPDDQEALTNAPTGTVVTTAQDEQQRLTATTSSGSSASFIYAIGRVSPTFPSLALEKEYAQAAGRSEIADLTDRQAAATVLRDNRYIARQMCWIFSIEGLETYILTLRDPADLDLLLEAVRPVPRGTDVDVVIGVRGPLAPPEVCNGLTVPIVLVDQLYSFDVDGFIKSIPKPESLQRKNFEPTAEEVFSRIMQMADNAGSSDEHRALNFLAVRYPAIYARTAEMFTTNHSLAGVDVRASQLSGARKIVDVIFTYSHRQTDVAERYLARVDVTEQFPFLVTKLTPFYQV